MPVRRVCTDTHRVTLHHLRFRQRPARRPRYSEPMLDGDPRTRARGSYAETRGDGRPWTQHMVQRAHRRRCVISPFVCDVANDSSDREVGELYMLLYDAILDGRAGHGREGYYFGESDESLFRVIAKGVGKAFVELGVCKPDQAEPTSFDETDYARHGNKHVRLCSRC